MKRVEISERGTIGSASTLCAVVGSFDPLHRGHEWIARYLLGRFERVLLLVPTRHLTKQVVVGVNASFAQRLAMLEAFRRRAHLDRLATGLTDEILFVRLRRTLATIFPETRTICFGMGVETFRMMLSSRETFRRMGERWGRPEREQLQTIARQAVVFARRATVAGAVRLPPRLREVSSTAVRKIAVALHQRGVPPAGWDEALMAQVDPEVIRFIRAGRIYVTCRAVDEASPRTVSQESIRV